MERLHKTRMAPTPSGFLHLGNVLSFSLTAALARREGASILLRIDDLDRERMSREYVEDIFETLNFLEIPWDEGPRDFGDFEREWSQVCRLGMYREALQRLRDEGMLYACDCSRSKVLREREDRVYTGVCRERGLSLDAKGCSWRVKMPAFAEASVGEGRLPAEMQDFVVRKKDGYPAYQLVSVVDDLFFGVDLVVRGEDLRASTEAQRWLAVALGRSAFERIRFYHHPLLMGSDGGKLSKSAGATSVRYLRAAGGKRGDVYGMIAGMAGVKGEVVDWQGLADAIGSAEWDFLQ
jgi:glutamyl/glutaminyl-tRNA synthetase